MPGIDLQGTAHQGTPSRIAPIESLVNIECFSATYSGHHHTPPSIVQFYSVRSRQALPQDTPTVASCASSSSNNSNSNRQVLLTATHHLLATSRPPAWH